MCIAISENNWEKTYFYIRNLTFFDSEQQKLLKFIKSDKSFWQVWPTKKKKKSHYWYVYLPNLEETKPSFIYI